MFPISHTRMTKESGRFAGCTKWGHGSEAKARLMWNISSNAWKYRFIRGKRNSA